VTTSHVRFEGRSDVLRGGGAVRATFELLCFVQRVVNESSGHCAVSYSRLVAVILYGRSVVCLDNWYSVQIEKVVEVFVQRGLLG